MTVFRAQNLTLNVRLGLHKREYLHMWKENRHLSVKGIL